MTKHTHKKAGKQIHIPWSVILIGIVAIAIFIFIIVSRTQPTAVNQSSTATTSLPATSAETKSTETALPAEISPEEVVKLQQEGAFILDVREISEWTEGHIEGATLIPLGELPNRLNEIPQDKKIVVVCRTGKRSAQGRDFLLNSGFSQVTSMAGGITAWQSHGYSIVTGN